MNEGQGPSEREAIARLRNEGCEVVVDGWPDLLVKNKKGRVFGLELKAAKDGLRLSQMDMHDALHRWVSLPTIIRRYSNLGDVADSEDAGIPSPRDLHDDVYREGYENGYKIAYEKATADAIQHFFGGGRAISVPNEV